MAGSLSYDLSRRVLAVVSEGLLHRAAAERFATGASSTSRWWALERENGDDRPKVVGGDQKSHRVYAHMAAILAALGPKRDQTIDEERAILRDEKGLAFGFGAIQWFFKLHAITRKKDGARHRTGPSRHPEAA